VTGYQDVLGERYRGGVHERYPFRDEIEAIFLDFATRMTAEELFHGAQARGLVFLPVNKVSDVVADPQLEANGFWRTVESPVLGALKYPLGVVASEELSPRTSPPPRLGEADYDIYSGELGLSEAEVASLRRSGVI
jgi:crotonobetainyl-CoA:carnitine CoA-transferase CaiB-like acyl-CoA transferase